LWRSDDVGRRSGGLLLRLFCLFCLFGFALVGMISCGEEMARPVPELAEILGIDDPRVRVREFSRYLDGVSLAELPEIRATLESRRLELDAAMGVELALWWTQRDPASAYDQGLRDYWIEGPLWGATVVREWARLDPESALAKVRGALASEGGPGWERTLSLALIRGWFDQPGRDLAPLVAFVETLEVGRPQKEALDLVLNELVAFRSPAEAIAFAESLPDLDEIGPSAFKRDTFKRLATQLAGRDPAFATKWVMEQSHRDYRDELVVRVARRWARDDGQAALAWASRLAASEPARPRAMLEAMRGWVSVDGPAAAAWIDAQPATDELAPLLKLSVLREANSKRPEAAMARLERLAPGPLKSELQVEVAHAWLRFDRPRAEAWIASAGLTEAQQRAIRQPAQPGRPPAPQRIPAPPQG